MLMHGVVLVILAVLSVQDIHTRQLSGGLLMALWAAAVLSLLFPEPGKNLFAGRELNQKRVTELLLALLPGLIFLSICLLNGSIGRGDAEIVLALGIMRGMSIWQDLTCAVFLAAAAALVLLALKKADRHTALPFVPFILAGNLLGVLVPW